MTRLLSAKLLCICLSIVMTFSGCSAPKSSELDSINWRVENRFRLFEKAPEADLSRVDALLDAFSQTESIHDVHEQIVGTLSGDEAVGLRLSHFDPISRKYSPELLQPSTYDVTTWLDGAPDSYCSWRFEFADGSKVSKSEHCREPISLEVPVPSSGVEATIPSFLANVEIFESQTTLSKQIQIRDTLILVLGDSFVSGEGNPDVPANFEGLWNPDLIKRIDRETFNKPRWPASKSLESLMEKELGLDTAEWWDVPCHRSLLSWPILAGLRQAAGNEQEAVTLIHLGCAGASITKGIIGPQGKLPGGERDTLGQLEIFDALQRQVSQRRKVDYIYLTAGGNDAGFGDLLPDLLAARLVPDKDGDKTDVLLQFSILANVNRPLTERARVKIAGLHNRFKSLNDHLQNLLAPTGRIIQLKYPSPLQFEFEHSNLQFCRTPYSAAEFEYLNAKLGELPDGPNSKAVEKEFARETEYLKLYFPEATQVPVSRDNAFDSLSGVLPEQIVRMANLSFEIELKPNDDALTTCIFHPDKGIDELGDASVCEAHWLYSSLNNAVSENKVLGWTIVTEHLEAIRKKGWCGKDVFDILSMPTLSKSGEWSHDSYRTFDPYEKDMRRWFRTTNDSAFTQYRNGQRYFHGTLHPTLNAHIEMAEAAYRAKEK